MSFEKVLEQGYVRLVNHMGSDLTVANAARVSYAKESVKLTERSARAFKTRERGSTPSRARRETE